MSPYPADLTEEQSATLEQAAFLVINARTEAAAMLTRPAPSNHRCGCTNYEGDGGPCQTTFLDFLGPDLGTGPPTVTCSHRPSEHLAT